MKTDDVMSKWAAQPEALVEDIGPELHERIVAVIELRAALRLLASATRARALRSWGRS